MLLSVLRRRSADDPPAWQHIPYTPADPAETIAAALTAINADPDRRDADGSLVAPIRWECSCMQRKCGACAMIINGRPRLACDARLAEFADADCVKLEPLRKFPVVADLIVDRSILFENLKTMALWATSDAPADEQTAEPAYEASRCLQCGCCLEICPNFYAGGAFAGMAAMVPAARLLTELPAEEQTALRKAYRAHVYEGCGKSLACRDICPAGIDMEGLLVHANAVAVWKRRFRRRKP